MAAQEITTPFVTPEQAGDVLGVSKSRVSRLVRWAREASSIADMDQHLGVSLSYTIDTKSEKVRTHAKSAARKTAKKAS